MKKFSILAIVMVVVCLMTACSISDILPLPTETATDAMEMTTAVTTEAVAEPAETTAATTEATTVAVTETTAAPTEETVPPTTKAPAPTQSSGVTPTTEIVSTGDGYRIIREDRSYRNSAGKVLIEHFYEYVEITAPVSGAEKINARFKGLADEFLWPESELREWLFDASVEYPYQNTKSATVTYISDKCICVTVSQDWWMGGVYNGGHEGYVYDLETGEKATLVSLAGEEPAELEAQLKAIVWEQLSNDLETPWEGSYEKLQGYTLDTFNYSIIDGEIVLFFEVYEFFSGAHGPVTVYTGIYA